MDGCGISDPDMLQIDHVNGDGHVDRKRNPSGKTRYGSGISGSNRYRDVFENPGRFQVLCANHHQQKTRMNKEFESESRRQFYKAQMQFNFEVSNYFYNKLEDDE